MTGNEQNVVKGQGFLGNSQHVQHSVTGFMLRVDFTRFCYRAQGKLMNAWVCIADLAGRRKPIPGGLCNAIHGVTYRPAPQYIP